MQVRTTSALFASNVLINLSGIVTGILLARLLGPEGRGAVASYTFLPTFLTGLLALSLPSAATLHIARLQPGLRARGADSISTLALIVALAMGPAAYLMLTLINRDVFATPLGLIATIFVTTEILRTTMLGISAGRREYFWLAAWRLLTPVLYLLLLVTFALKDLSVTTAVVAVVAANAISAVLLMLPHTRRFVFDRKFMRAVVGSALRLHPPGMLRILRFNIDRLAIVLLLPAEQVGHYFVALTFASAPYAAAQQSLASQLLSEFSLVRAGAERNRMARRAAYITAAVSASIFAILLLILPIVVPFLIGEEFSEVPTIASLLATGFMLRMVLVVATAYLESHRATTSLSLAEVAYLAGFVGAWATILPDSGSAIACCVLVGFVLNALYIGSLFARIRTR